MVYICDSTPLNINKVDNLLKNPFKNLKHEEQLEIKRLGPYQPRDINIFQKDGRKLRTFSSTWFDKKLWLTACDERKSLFSFAVSYLEVRVHGQKRLQRLKTFVRTNF